jgi:hypothetical protein
MNKFYQIIKIFQGGAARIFSGKFSRLNNRKGDQVIFSFLSKGLWQESIYFPQPMYAVHIFSSQLLHSNSTFLNFDKDIAHPF